MKNTTQKNTTQKITLTLTLILTLTLTLTLTIVLWVSFYGWSKLFWSFEKYNTYNTTRINHVYTTHWYNTYTMLKYSTKFIQHVYTTCWYSTNISERCSYQERHVLLSVLKSGKEKVKTDNFIQHVKYNTHTTRLYNTHKTRNLYNTKIQPKVSV